MVRDDGADDANRGGVVGEDSDHVSAPVDLFVQACEVAIGPGRGVVISGGPQALTISQVDESGGETIIG